MSTSIKEHHVFTSEGKKFSVTYERVFGVTGDDSRLRIIDEAHGIDVIFGQRESVRLYTMMHKIFGED